MTECERVNGWSHDLGQSQHLQNVIPLVRKVNRSSNNMRITQTLIASFALHHTVHDERYALKLFF